MREHAVPAGGSRFRWNSAWPASSSTPLRATAPC